MEIRARTLSPRGGRVQSAAGPASQAADAGGSGGRPAVICARAASSRASTSPSNVSANPAGTGPVAATARHALTPLGEAGCGQRAVEQRAQRGQIRVAQRWGREQPHHERAGDRRAADGRPERERETLRGRYSRTPIPRRRRASRGPTVSPARPARPGRDASPPRRKPRGPRRGPETPAAAAWPPDPGRPDRPPDRPPRAPAPGPRRPPDPPRRSAAANRRRPPVRVPGRRDPPPAGERERARRPDRGAARRRPDRQPRAAHTNGGAVA
jgi:hypothetical protein